MQKQQEAPALLLSAVLLITVLAPGVATASETQRPSSLARSKCAVALPADERIDCYTLTVPENRSKSSTNTIRLPIVVFRSRSRQPRPDPIVFTAGGPGQAPSELFLQERVSGCSTIETSSSTSSVVRNTLSPASIAPRLTRNTKAPSRQASVEMTRSSRRRGLALRGLLRPASIYPVTTMRKARKT